MPDSPPHRPPDPLLLSGYMIVRNVVEQGYPYLEAILGALPACDEFLVLDGCSTDTTWAGLEAIESVFPDRIRLFREPWEGPTNHGEVLAGMSNRLRHRCRGEFCINLQANELIDADAVTRTVEFLAGRPDIDLTRIPFLTVMGRRLHWLKDHRRRLFRNRPDIASLNDAYDVGHVPSTGNGNSTPPVTGAIDNHPPVYRYRGLFPVNYIRKLENRLDLFRDPKLRYFTMKELEFARAALRRCRSNNGSIGDFWQQIRHYLEDGLWRDNPAGFEPEDQIPRATMGFFDPPAGQLDHLADRWEYDLADSLAAVAAAGVSAPRTGSGSSIFCGDG